MANNLLLGLDLWPTALLATLAIAVAYFLKRGYQARRLVDKLRKQGMVMNLQRNFTVVDALTDL